MRVRVRVRVRVFVGQVPTHTGLFDVAFLTADETVSVEKKLLGTTQK